MQQGALVRLTVWMKQCSLSSWAYSTPSLMKTEMALRMNDTNRFMWMKFLVQCSFLVETGRGEHSRQIIQTMKPLIWETQNTEPFKLRF